MVVNEFEQEYNREATTQLHLQLMPQHVLTDMITPFKQVNNDL